MDLELLREYCLAKKAVTEGFPFGEDTLVFKVSGKIFLIVSLNSSPLQFNIKCDPEKAIELREQFSAVLPGYHMNKKMWNTVIINNSIPAKLIRSMIDDSYQLVVKTLPAKLRSGLL